MATGMIERFESLWEAGPPAPDVFAFLETSGAPGADEQLAIVLRDQQGRWGTDRPLMVEDYLARLPALAGDPDCKIKLILGEFFTRRACGLSARVDDFLARFGEISALIRGALDGLEAGEETLARSTNVEWEGCGDASGPGATTSDPPPAEPRMIGRYRVLDSLGRGAFGLVYLAHDDELDRGVAVKVPSPERFRGSEDAEAFLVEARMAARLDHPNIVPVHDVGRSLDGSIFVVSKLIAGRTLKDLIREDRPGPAAAADLIAVVARALDHAHRRGLIHRDVKPENILIEDETGTPYMADFGLAIREEDHPRAGLIAGTPAYMSPEQARGEGHRLDGRSDVFSLGVVLYELLVGRKPFYGFLPVAVLRQVEFVEPRPPRELDASIPPELERICLKALAKRASDRYPTMQELADDLARWEDDPGAVREGPPIIPRGLRAFGADDAHFFVDLVPGPRDRQGLPEGIRFWKRRIEERNPEKTFNVGLLYGPSGCGKSSLVRAGLLPRLAPAVVAVCVDSSPDDTERLLLRALRKREPRLPAGRGLAETFAWLRLSAGRKVVVILDQFEQWLHVHGIPAGSELVDALRQCDGGRLQAIIMVRDDFAMAAARFMDALDIPIVQGSNFATLDLLPVEHARAVLARFGQAFGRLPAGPVPPSSEQRRFLDAVAAGLAREGKVVPIRLALFAEMVKARPWAPATLKEAGGTEGIGVNFLEETFRSRTANPAHRPLEEAARNVLKALLPGVGSDIKGNRRSSAELREASGLGDRPGEFAALLRVLDGELRLLTPTDPPESPAAGEADLAAQYWQLTHDYLVPSLRQWLYRKQKETRRGRAELRLSDRAVYWSARRERRELPTAWEWIGIRLLTEPGRWGAAEKAMMRRAGRLYGLRLAAACGLAAVVLVGALIVAGREEVRRRQAAADGLVAQLLVADVAHLPEVVSALDRLEPFAAPRLAAVAGDSRSPREARLRASYALADRPGAAASRLIDLAATSDHRELAVISDRLAPYSGRLRGEFRRAVGRDSLDPAAQLRIMALQAASTREDDAATWRGLARPVVTSLLTLETLELDAWIDLLRPAAPTLTPALREWFRDDSGVPSERVNAARVLGQYAQGPLLAELLLEANASQFPMLLPAAARHEEAVLAAARRAFGLWGRATPGDARRVDARRTRNAAIALLRLDRSREVEPLLAAGGDSTVRTMLMLEMRDFGVQPDLLLGLLREWADPAARQAVFLALEPYRDREWSPAARRALAARLADGPSRQAERSAAEWLARRWGDMHPARLAPPGPRLPAAPAPGAHGGGDWHVTSEGHTMAVIDAPRPFAVSTHEVTAGQYRRFLSEVAPERLKEAAPGKLAADLLPASFVSFADAMRYCRWLSQREGICEDQMCYPPDAVIVRDATSLARLDDEHGARTGYRLPTEQEWGLVTDAGAVPDPDGKPPTLSFVGSSPAHLGEFAWCADNSERVLHPVGLLRPNPLGLFDAIGNVGEWCHAVPAEGERQGKGALRGGNYRIAADLARRYLYDTIEPSQGYSFTGFRVARTVAPGRPMGE